MTRRESVLSAMLLGVALLALTYGWWVFWFLCDDAFIAFRYVSNSQLGLGYTWNPPPFRPVEGYTSFLWVVLLDGVWSWLGVEPPDSANVLSLLFAYGSLFLVAAMGMRMRFSTPAFARLRLPFLALVLLGTVTNRTFLAWTSSGLETSMETFLLLLWALIALFFEGEAIWLLALTLCAALLELARPDGLMYLAATVAIFAARTIGAWRCGALGYRFAVAALPFLSPVAHLLWRDWKYGYWLPNTYYAKYVAPWPLAGAAYLASFLLEYAYWVWLVIAVMLASRYWRRIRRDGLLPLLGQLDEGAAIRTIGVGAILGQFTYYTFVIGGDHFEYRIYQHIVPLVFLSLPWICERLAFTPRKTIFAFVAMIVLGWPIPWTHWAYTHTLNTRPETRMMRFKVAPHLPLVMRWYGLAWDGLQYFLVSHLVGSRHQAHKVFCEFQFTRFPSREEGLKVDGKDFPVFPHISIGVPGWVLPNVAIIDEFGLNDAVVAHSPARRTSQTARFMAHDRKPPRGYVSCFRPNVEIDEHGAVTVKPRKKPLTAADIEECESRFMKRVERHDR